MRPYPTVLLARMLLLFFTRRVLSLGALRSRAVRGLAAGGSAALMAASAVTAYRLLDTAAQRRPDVWTLLFELVTVSVVAWVQIAFILVKVLFLNAEGLLRLSYQLPLTNRERAGALLVYEAGIVAIITGVGTGSCCLAATLLLGLGAVPLVIESVVLPAALTYLVLSVVHLVVFRILLVLRARRLSAIASVAIQFVLLLAYARRIPELTSDISMNHLRGDDDVVWVGLLASVQNRHGQAAMVLTGLGIMVVLVVACLALSSREHVGQSRYVRITAWRRGGVGLGYDLCLLRSSQTILTGAAALAAFVSLCLDPVVNPLWGLSLTSMAGLYLYAATEPLRALGLDRTAPWVVYMRLVRGQLMLVIAFGLPAMALVELLTTRPLGGSLQALGGCLAGVLLTTTVGILFPAEHDNPFSVLMGLSLAAVVVGLVGIGVGLLQLPEMAMRACLLVVLAASVCYGVLGIGISERRRRHEEVHAGREQRRGRAVGDPHRRRGKSALPHVLRG